MIFCAIDCSGNIIKIKILVNNLNTVAKIFYNTRYRVTMCNYTGANLYNYTGRNSEQMD